MQNDEIKKKTIKIEEKNQTSKKSIWKKIPKLNKKILVKKYKLTRVNFTNLHLR